MREIDPHRPDALEHGGTFTANPVTMAAGAAALELLTREELVRLDELGDLARGIVAEGLAPIAWEARGRGSLLRPFPKSSQSVDKATQRAIWWAAYERGLLLSQHTVAALSTPMDRGVVEDIAERLVDAVLTVVKEA
jgi:glutamate-1-semialdehyde 2,1-aminomutase